MYQQLRYADSDDIDTNRIRRVSDGATIPFNPANKDYQEYLEWVSEGNTPEPAE